MCLKKIRLEMRQKEKDLPGTQPGRSFRSKRKKPKNQFESLRKYPCRRPVSRIPKQQQMQQIALPKVQELIFAKLIFMLQSTCFEEQIYKRQDVKKTLRP
jgi:hypothetical protein